MKPLETKKVTLKNGTVVLARDDGTIKTFANRTQAEKAAALNGGYAFQCFRSRVFFVGFEA